MRYTAKQIEEAFNTPPEGPELKLVVKELLRDYRLKRKILGYTEHIFDVFSKEEKREIFKEAIIEIINRYQIRDINKLYDRIRWKKEDLKE